MRSLSRRSNSHPIYYLFRVQNGECYYAASTLYSAQPSCNLFKRQCRVTYTIPMSLLSAKQKLYRKHEEYCREITTCHIAMVNDTQQHR